jgi:hypothetical protein
MKTRNILCAAVFVTATCGAHADSATWLFRVDGSGAYAEGSTYGCPVIDPIPEYCPHSVTWQGIFTVETVSGADGTYDAGHVSGDTWVYGGIMLVSLVSNVGGDYVDVQASPGAQYFPGGYPYAVTVAGNRVTSIEWTSEDMPEGVNYIHVDGFDVQYRTSSYHGDYADVTGTLTAIPEPGGAALSLLGLAAVALAIRRAGASRARG